MSFETIGEHEIVRMLVVGAGHMGRHWIELVEASPDYELVGIVDVDVAAARRAAVEVGRPELPVGAGLLEAIERTRPHAIGNATIPEVHHAITTTSLLSGVSVLSEKPIAASLAESLSIAAAAEVSGRLTMISQSRRHNRQLSVLRSRRRRLGAAGIASTEFFRAPRFGGFREQMEHPLLLDMAVHAFDSARYLLDEEPLAVYCEEYNPPWSWYRGDAAATALFEMTGGVRYAYTASWASAGLETSWNGNWRVSCENGTALWDGDHEPVSEPRDSGAVEPDAAETGFADGDPDAGTADEGVAASLGLFARALRTGIPPSGEVHENILSHVMVEAAIVSADSGRRVLVDEVLERALHSALRAEVLPSVAERLRGWPGAAAVIRDAASAAAGFGRASLVSGLDDAD
ncbi:Gfo/Idh/MocA family protein [Compostimonas suwonensis]|uniref:Putative dehydrogenase n=1 Tax=Compostimonas suwonensis TaxID=1048394 RepID=A0A2M9BVX2_9MICO|nr:Gfo/Idh/MocA family oxidoreductase [Compostimonas suwonensis]PJJ62089.1 putative dehydrogenase [Compostimonas suwonensis]